MQKKRQRKAPSIWIVDDDKKFCWILKSFLFDNKFKNVAAFYSCESVLDQFSRSVNYPDIILLDINFSPQAMSGFDLLKSIKPLSAKTKFLMMTSFGGNEYIRVTLKQGAVGFINKVQSSNDILRAIHIALLGGVYADTATLSQIIPSTTRENDPPALKIRTSRRTAPIQAEMNTLRKWIAENIEGIRMIEDISSIFQRNQETLRKNFSRVYHKPLMKIVQEERIKKTMDLLKTTDLKCFEIAYKVGFQREDSASRAFKKNAGCSMEEYRNAHTENIPRGKK